MTMTLTVKTSVGTYELAETFEAVAEALTQTNAFAATKTDGGRALIFTDTVMGVETGPAANRVGFAAAMERYAEAA